LATIEAAMPELRDLDAPEFALIRARLARAYLEHKADIGAAHADDAEIVARVDAISEVMLATMKQALTTRHKPWLMRYSWFVGLVNELLDDLPGKPLDG
jgi:hypothetical protein